MCRLHVFLEPRSQNEIDLYVEKVGKRRNQTEIGDNRYKFSDLDTRKVEMNKELKFAEYNDLEDLVFKLQLTNSEITEILGTKYICTSSTRFILLPGIYKICDIKSI